MRWLSLVALAWLTISGCAPDATPTVANTSTESQPTKRITAAIAGDAFTFYNKLNIGNGVPGIEDLEDMAAAGLANFDNHDQLRPQLGETAPTAENGLWKVFPDGRMEVTWRIREGASWHDGTPFTSADLVFSATVLQDMDIPVFRDPRFAYLDRVTAPDARTVVVHWKQPFVEADKLFTRDFGLPIPKHLLEEAYARDKTVFPELPYWGTEFVHAGPYRVRELALGSHAILEANDHYVLGRPKIDVIEVRFILAQPPLISNILAGAVDVSMGRGLTPEAAIETRDQWAEGRMEHSLSNSTRIYPKLDNPTTPIVADTQFRQALLHATDRQQLIESFQFGLVRLSDSYLPDVPQFKAINDTIVRYDYDPRRAAQIIEGLGYRKAGDGFYQDASGARLAVEIRAPDSPTQVNVLYAIGDYWQRAGIATEAVVIPRQRNQDREYRNTRCCFHMTGGTMGLAGIQRNLHSSQIPTPEKGWAGSNDSHYNNPTMDALIERYQVTIPMQERMDIVRQMVRIIADELPVMLVFYTIRPFLISNRITGIAPSPGNTQTWNVDQWDVR